MDLASFLMNKDYYLSLPLPPPYKLKKKDDSHALDINIYINDITGKETSVHPLIRILELYENSQLVDEKNLHLDNNHSNTSTSASVDNDINNNSIQTAAKLKLPEISDALQIKGRKAFIEFKCDWKEIALFDDDRSLFGLTMRYYEDDGSTLIKYDREGADWFPATVESPYGLVDKYDLFITSKVKILGRKITLTMTNASTCQNIKKESVNLLKRQNWLQEKLESIGATPIVKRQPPKVSSVARSCKMEGQINLRRIYIDNIKLSEQMIDAGLGHFLKNLNGSSNNTPSELPNKRFEFDESIYNSVASSVL